MIQLSDFTKLSPSASFKIWGGSRLAIKKGIKASSEPLGETWEVSAHPDGPSMASGTKLSQLVSASELPYLIKFIDTSDNLSIQVHPDNEYAKLHENQLGKTECWIILEAGEGAGLYLGLKNGITKDDFKKAILNSQQVDQLMNFYPVKRGQFFYVPAGSLHAIGKNVLMCEIQQSSGVTYRVWDWNRVDSKGKPRELHVEKAMDVACFEPRKNELNYFRYQENIFEKNGLQKVVEHDDFHLQVLKAKAGDQFDFQSTKRLKAVVGITGNFIVNDQSLNEFEAGVSNGNIKLNCQKDGICLIVT